jgi:hypothetical protein
MTNEMFLQLGTYNLHICGKSLVKELNGLVRDNEGLLRQGEDTQNTEADDLEISTPSNDVITPPRTALSASNGNAIISPTYPAIDTFNHEKESIAYNKENNMNNFDKASDTSDSDDSKSDQYQTSNTKDTDMFVRKSTQIPFQDSLQIEDINYINNGGQVKENQDTDSEAPDETPEFGLNIPTQGTKATTVSARPLAKPKNTKTVAANLKFSLPMVLDKVFKMALRKSMVTLNGGKSCVPGSIDTMKCNTCFCLKNGKLLCTNNQCNSN